jgi:DNA-binding NarL/FixJ family response regulator
MKSLYALVDLAGREADRLEAALARSAENRGGSLAAIESLGEPAALDDPQSLARVAAQVTTTGAGGDLFADNDRQVAIARLADQGLTPAEIARRLSLPIGEVELLLNLRSA